MHHNARAWLRLLMLLALWPTAAAAQQEPPEILRHPERVALTNLHALNTPYREVNLNVAPDGRDLYFMSTRGGQPWTGEPRVLFGKRPFDGDLYHARQVEGQWQAPTAIPAPVNTSRGEDEPVFSPDGQRVYFQSWRSGWQVTGGPYYMATLDGERWDRMSGLGQGIGDFFAEHARHSSSLATDGMCVSPAEDLFIVAFGYDYQGAMDLFFSRKVGGLWQPVAKMPLSTPGDERSAFLAADGRTLYFASDGLGGFGGLDIFKTTLGPDGSHGPIFNIGEPFNTSRDDFGFVVAGTGKDAYFVRDDDILHADLQGTDPRLRPVPVRVVRGQVADSLGRPVGGQVSLLKGRETLSTATSNRLTGEFLLVTTEMGSLELLVKLPGKVPYRQAVPAEADSSVYTERELPLALPPLADEPPPQPLRPILGSPREARLALLFDSDSHALRPDALAQLQALRDSLPAGQVQSLRLVARADSDAPDDYNLRLSQRRLRAVQDWLAQEAGWPPSLLADAQALGEAQPLAPDDGPEGKQRNRSVLLELRYLPPR